jgi:hypothetical protein
VITQPFRWPHERVAAAAPTAARRKALSAMPSAHVVVERRGLTPTSCGVIATADGPPNASMLADMLACVSATPLGMDVDPDVNCTSAMSSGDGHTSGSSAVASRSSRQRTSDRSGHAGRICSKDGASARVVTTARAPDARRRADVIRNSGPPAGGGRRRTERRR